jgi:hypothetical protein
MQHDRSGDVRGRSGGAMTNLAPGLTHALRTPDSNAKLRVQRKCGCGGACGSCSEEEKKKKVQRRAIGDAGTDVPRSVQSVLGSAGRPLDAETRATMESRFGRSFADVRVHTDSHAAASAHDISAAAYTAGTHIVFGSGRFSPGTLPGRRLLAHELAHVAQQTSGASSIAEGIGPADDEHERAADRVADAVVAQGSAFVPPPPIAPAGEHVVRRKREEGEPAIDDESAPRFIVEDESIPGPGQMRRKTFVDELDAVVCATSDREMARLGQSTDNCPLLAKWRPRIRTMAARQLEVSMRRWIGDASVRNAHDYIPLVAAKLTESIRVWGATGNAGDIPPDLLALFEGTGPIRIGVGSLIRGAVGRLFRKPRDGAAAPASGVAFDAGGGRPLDNGVASRMGQAFGRDFSGVRIHTDTNAAAAATSMNARAFTIGRDIAFAGGEYAPGTIIGDALLAHELAHVAQQEEAQQDGAMPFQPKSEAATGELERDADSVAVHAVSALWPSLRRFTRDMRSAAMPRLKSSLKLQRCDASPAELQEYLRLLDRTKKIEDHGDSDDKARQIAAAWSKGDTQYVLTARRKKLLIEEMLDGDVSGDDQEQILNLLERSWPAELKQMIGPGGVPHGTLLSKFGKYKEELWSFYMRRYADAYPEAVKRAIDFADEAPSPQPPPDVAKLDGIEPGGAVYQVVQPGDNLPNTTQPLRVSTNRSLRKLQKGEAAQWVLEQYSTLITADQTKAVKTAPVNEYDAEDYYRAYVGTCMRYYLERRYDSESDRRKRENRDRAEAVCAAEERNTAGFHDPEDNSIVIHRERQTPETMIHEVLHAFADPRVHELGKFATEGLTEFLTRRVIVRHKSKSKDDQLYLGGHYDDAYDAMQELALVVGPELLERVHFQGKVTELCNALGKARFDAWNEAMEDRDNGAAATRILRGETPVTPTKDKCT